MGRNDDFDIISLNLKNNFDQIIKNANAQEERLWKEVPDDMEMSAENLMEALPGIKQEYFLESEDFPAGHSETNFFVSEANGSEEIDEAVNPDLIRAQKTLDNIGAVAKKDYEDVAEEYGNRVWIFCL